MRLGLVGRGYWGNTYANVLSELGIEFWQAGRDWKKQGFADAIIVACSTEAHYEVARFCLCIGMPVLVEKPMTLRGPQARELEAMGGIGFVSHTRLYDPAWAIYRDGFKTPPKKIEAWAGGVNETNPDALWNWLTHLIPMCLDLGFDPMTAVFHITEERKPLRFVADGLEFQDSSGALANLVAEFCGAIEKNEPDNRGIELGARVVEITERLICPDMRMSA